MTNISEQPAATRSVPADHEQSAHPAGPADLAALAEPATALVRRWLGEAASIPVDASGTQLAGVLKDPRGLDFTVGFVDGVVRPEDLAVAAANLKTIAPLVPAFLPWYMRAAVRLGGTVAPLLPGVVIPVSRAVLRRMVGHLIVDATDARLGQAIAKIRGEGIRLNMNLLGEAVLGQREAARRLEGTHALLARPDVDYVSIKVSSTVAPHPAWAFDEAVEHVVASLTPLFARAAAATTPKFINLDMEEYKDLDLTIEVFTRILDRPEFRRLEAGIVLQAYLPDALSAMMRLQEWSAGRRAAGGAPIKVRIVKGANLPMERVEASLHDWPLATWGSKLQSDTNYKRVLDYALQPERTANVRVGVAGHNLFDIAFAWLLAGQRGVRDGIEFEMLLGMAQGQAEAVRRDIGELLLYTPVVHPREFDVAIAYLIRRLEEGASTDNFMSAVFELSENEALFERERQRFLASLAGLDAAVLPPHRVQNRAEPLQGGSAAASTSGEGSATGFSNTPDTDPSVPANRAWGRAILDRVPESTLGADTLAAAAIDDEPSIDRVIDEAIDGAAAWAALGGAGRAEVLHRAGDALEASRAALMEVMARETGKTLDQSDPEVSEAIDFAHFYAERARELDEVDGAVFVPARLTVVTPPWNFPVAIPAGSTLAALAAGSAVILKPAPQAALCAAVLVETLWSAGIPRDVLRFVKVEENEVGERLISHPGVDRVILTGAYQTAELFRTFRPDLELLAETSGKNAIIVAPSADIDLAVKDVVTSAFGHAGQKCSAASLVILVGSVADSRRFRDQLVDAVSSLRVGYPTDPAAQMGPIIEPAAGKLLDGLTTLGEGEEWLVKPEPLDSSGRLWSPGVRSGVRRGSDFHLVEYFGPILGIMTADTLDEAIALQNEVDYGLTAGLHSLEPRDLRLWLDTVQAGNLYVNRGITGAIVRRQPFGGWKKSAVGAGTKAGGPNYLIGLGSWMPTPSRATSDAPPADGVTRLITAARSPEAGLTTEEIASLERAARSDQTAWSREFGVARDVSGLTAERNILRYVARPVTVRLAEGALVSELVRVLIAGVRAGSPVSVSSSVELPAALRASIQLLVSTMRTETEAEWIASAAAAGSADSTDGAATLNATSTAGGVAATGGGAPPSRVRLIGGDPRALIAATGSRPDLAIHHGAVTEAGRIELLPFLQEQAISITAHRFGTPNHLSEGLI